MKAKCIRIFSVLFACAALTACGQKQAAQEAQEAASSVVSAQSASESGTSSSESSAKSQEETASAVSSSASSETGSTETGTASPETQGEVASASETVEAEDVVQDWMVPVTADQLVPGTYPVTVDSSSSMFRIEACELTVADGAMRAVMTMGGTGYKYLYMGTGEEAAAAEEADFIPFVEEGDVHRFTVPVEALDSGVDCAAFSKKKEKWYERVLVFRADSLPVEAFAPGAYKTTADLGLEDGEYQVNVELYGGSGKAGVESPARLTVSGEDCLLELAWSSPHYDYMIVNGEKYLPVNEDGNSVFEVPVSVFDRPFAVIADTTAMSEPHEITYTLRLDAESVE